MNRTQTWTREGFARLETLFHTANGYLGVRAAPEEGAAEGWTAYAAPISTPSMRFATSATARSFTASRKPSR